MNISRLYDSKDAAYFGNARHDIVRRLTTNATSAVLELGCGAGGTGAAALAAGKAGRYTGIELSPKAAAAARQRLTEVIEANVEELDLSSYANQFDALIISEVLEHLTDPWRVVRDLAGCLRPGGQVFASSPNIAQWKMLRSLLLGQFDYEASGLMDRTHLRWFTPKSYRTMFEEAGFRTISIDALVPPALRTRLVNRLTGARFEHLFMRQIMYAGIRSEPSR